MIVSLYRKFWSPKCWNQLAGNFDVYLYTKHHFPLYLLFEILWRHCKLAFLKLWECLTMPIKNHNINLWETFTLICMQKINFITQDIAKEIANLLLWQFAHSWPYTPKMKVSIWRNLILSICRRQYLSTC